MDTSKDARLAAVADLRNYDHAFITPKGVARFNAALGVDIKPYTAWADPNDPKGLTFDDGAKSGQGCDAAYYAEEACRLAGSPFEPWQSGRGSRLRSACDALEALFKA